MRLDDGGGALLVPTVRYLLSVSIACRHMCLSWGTAPRTNQLPCAAVKREHFSSSTIQTITMAVTYDFTFAPQPKNGSLVRFGRVESSSSAPSSPFVYLPVANQSNTDLSGCSIHRPSQCVPIWCATTYFPLCVITRQPAAAFTTSSVSHDACHKGVDIGLNRMVPWTIESASESPSSACASVRRKAGSSIIHGVSRLPISLCACSMLLMSACSCVASFSSSRISVSA
ncbi:hypothetical protein BKA82DRAFT_616485 [Pisolithus tinctorius]|nr:hypothetical protein BKA82DRAFT_616485 [Pisolithus tinctorius]